MKIRSTRRRALITSVPMPRIFGYWLSWVLAKSRRCFRYTPSTKMHQATRKRKPIILYGDGPVNACGIFDKTLPSLSLCRRSSYFETQCAQEGDHRTEHRAKVRRTSGGFVYTPDRNPAMNSPGRNYVEYYFLQRICGNRVEIDGI